MKLILSTMDGETMALYDLEMLSIGDDGAAVLTNIRTGKTEAPDLTTPDFSEDAYNPKMISCEDGLAYLKALAAVGDPWRVVPDDYIPNPLPEQA